LRLGDFAVKGRRGDGGKRGWGEEGMGRKGERENRGKGERGSRTPNSKYFKYFKYFKYYKYYNNCLNVSWITSPYMSPKVMTHQVWRRRISSFFSHLMDFFNSFPKSSLLKLTFLRISFV
jgi:hypothetical protein